MGSMLGAKTPKTPAQKPEREVDVTAEDIEYGADETGGEKLKTKGKRSLIKPTQAGSLNLEQDESGVVV